MFNTGIDRLERFAALQARAAGVVAANKLSGIQRGSQISATHPSALAKPAGSKTAPSKTEASKTAASNTAGLRTAALNPPAFDMPGSSPVLAARFTNADIEAMLRQIRERPPRHPGTR